MIITSILSTIFFTVSLLLLSVIYKQLVSHYLGTIITSITVVIFVVAVNVMFLQYMTVLYQYFPHHCLFLRLITLASHVFIFVMMKMVIMTMMMMAMTQRR